MDKFNQRVKPAKQAAPGACPMCGAIHSFRCAVDGCTNTGTMTDSISHKCAGQARWVCRHHWAERA